MTTNVLKAISNIIDSEITNINYYNNFNQNVSNRIHNVGFSLENFIQDAFTNSFFLEDSEKLLINSNFFSYIANKNNPPDLIIKNGDAFEIKKIQSYSSNIFLNSSYPKDKLYSDSKMVTKACLECEEKKWLVKDMCYIIASVDLKGFINNIWFVYGDCYCADREVYERIQYNLSDHIHSLGIDLLETNEIAKIKRIDPLGITDLRLRGMWSFWHPSKVFDYLVDSKEKKFIRAVMLKEKFYSLDKNTIDKISKQAVLKNIKIKNPNNPANLLDAVLVEYFFKKNPNV